MELNSSPIKLQDIIDIKHGFAFKGEYFKDQETNIVLVTPGNFRIGGGFKSDKLKYYDGPIESDYVLKEGDLVVTMTDLSKQADTLGYSALIPRSERYTFLHNQRVGLVTIKQEDKIDKNFLYFLLRTSEYRHFIVGSATGSTVKHTSPSRILSYSCKLPEVIVQKKISKLLIGLEKKIDINSLLNSQLESLAQAIFKSWFVDFDPVHAKKNALEAGLTKAQAERASMAVIAGLCSPTEYAENTKEIEKKLEERLASIGEEKAEELKATSSLFPSEFENSELGVIPKEWKVTELESISDILNGFAFKSEDYEPSGVFVLRTKNFNEQGFAEKLHDDVFLSEEKAKEYQSYYVQAFDIHLVMVAASIGKTCITPPSLLPALRNQNMWCFRNKDNFPYRHILNLIVPIISNNLKGFSSGSARDFFRKGDFQKYKVVLPEESLLAKTENILKALFEMIASNIAENNSLINTRDLILPRLISGEIDLSEVSLD